MTEGTFVSSQSTNGYIEIVNDSLNVGNIHSALFDFDGTISVMREGWQEIMLPLMIEILSDTPNHEDSGSMEQFARNYIAESTGIDTIYQMMRLSEEVVKRGGPSRDPMDYKKEYLKRLWQRIEHRVADVKSGRVNANEMLMCGAVEFLDALKQKGIAMYVASGTDHANVVDEANALGVNQYFGEHIYGALDNYWERSKAKVIQDILRNNDLRGNSLVVFGDGYVEIENCKEAGGIAIGVASDEVNRCGLNEWKRERLVRAGADVIVPDFSNVPALIELLFPLHN